MLTPCIDCKDRHPVCHASCALFLEYKRENEKRKSIIAKNKQMENLLFPIRSGK